MRATEIIAKKRDGGILDAAEIDFFVQGFTRGEIPDYQASAWAMAVLLRGMTPEETTALTMAMVRSGDTLDLRAVGPVVVDKHSTGGVGDKTTLVVAPWVAAAGLPVAKMSGRGLGFSGGTLDKLEAIPGFNVRLSLDEFFATVADCGVVVAGQTAHLVPADGKLYALRDVTATVPSLPLIASSIMSKKIAGGADAMVLDVKLGRGAFMPTLQDARELARAMMAIGEGVGRRVTAVLSDMNQPLGLAVGNALEVREAIAALQGAGPADLIDHCRAIAAEMLVLGGIHPTPEAAGTALDALLAGGEALARFRRWVSAQHGDARIVDDPDLLPHAVVVHPVAAPRAGYVAEIDAQEVGLAAVELGAGRERKEDPVDYGVGIVLGPKVGDYVNSGDRLLTVHARAAGEADRAAARLLAAYRWSDAPTSAPPLIYEILR